MNFGNVGNDEAVGEVEVTPCGTIVLRVLDGPDALLAVLVLFLRTEVVVKVVLQPVVAIQLGVGIFNHLLQVFLIDAGHLVGVGIVLMISLVEIYLCQEGGSGSLRGATFLLLYLRQYAIGILQVVDNLLPAFVVAVLRVRQGHVGILGHVQLVDERNLLEQTLQLEMSVSTQELHLASTLLDGRVCLVGFCQHVE